MSFKVFSKLHLFTLDEEYCLQFHKTKVQSAQGKCIPDLQLWQEMASVDFPVAH